MNPQINAKLESLRTRLETELIEHTMVGFSLAKRYKPEVLLRLKTELPMGSGKEDSKGKVEVWVSPAGKKDNPWIGAFTKLAEKALPPLIEKEGHFPTKNGYRIDPTMSGIVEIGGWNEQNSYSDDSYLAIRGDTPELTKAVMDILQKAVPVGGGGVAGSSYKGAGASGGGTEYSYHYHSYGIGD